MFWGSIPCVFILEYWEHYLPVTDIVHRIFQVIILGMVFGWIWFWYQRILDIEIMNAAKARIDPKSSHESRNE
jgi:hypothetical protein